MKKRTRGIVHVYTGNGKGKTTAAIGLAVRAAGAGLKVSMHQFMKNSRYGEVKAIKNIKNIEVKQCGRKGFIRGKPGYKDVECAAAGLRAATKDIFSRKYDIVILDEINIALCLGLVKTGEVLSLITRKPEEVELVLTGRRCPSAILKKADLITEMREIRHPFRKGLAARRGIEY